MLFRSAASSQDAAATSALLSGPSHALRPPPDAMLDPPDPDDDAAPPSSPSRALAAAASPRGLVLACADLLHRGDLEGARRVAGAVLSGADPRGDAADRLAHHFARALALRADDGHGAGAPAVVVGVASSAAYLAYNKIAPFLRFAHLTANQAILEDRKSVV